MIKHRGILWDTEKSQILDCIAQNDYSIEKTLVRRGFTFKSRKNFLSEKLLIENKLWPNDLLDKFFSVLDDRTHRAILKFICANKSSFSEKDLTQRWANPKVAKLLKSLLTLKIISEMQQGIFSLSRKKAEFGENFEWYVAELFKRKFFSTADWGIHIVEAPNGGDYDVLARPENNIIYVECKTKSPSSLKEEELISFLKRDEFLRPYVAIMLFDTSDKVEKIEKMFNHTALKIKTVIEEQKIDFVMGEPPYTENLENSFFHFQSRLFFINSQRSISENIKLCLRHRHRVGELEQACKGRFWLHELLLKTEKWF